MATLVDTNVLFRSLSAGHTQQPLAERALSTLRLQGEELFLAHQNLVEFWAVATRPAALNGLGLDPTAARAEIDTLRRLFRTLPQDAKVLDTWLDLVTQCAVSGKNTHDAHLAAAMRVAGLSRILTFNVSDFRRFPGIVALDPAAF